MAAEEGLKISEMPVLNEMTGREYIPVVDENGDNKKMSTEGLAKKGDIPNISQLATKEELKSKLDTATYNSEKVEFATKKEIGDINTILDTINGEII